MYKNAVKRFLGNNIKLRTMVEDPAELEVQRHRRDLKRFQKEETDPHWCNFREFGHVKRQSQKMTQRPENRYHNKNA